VTRDVIMTLGVLLGAGLAARFVAGLVNVPEMLALVAIGLPVGLIVEVPLASIGAQLLFTLGVAMILFYGGLNLSLPVLRRVWMSIGLLVVPGVVLTAVVVGSAAYAVFDVSWTAALLLGAVLAPTDPAILIPLFVGSRLREKVAQTVVAESAFNDPTGAALALAFAGVLVNGGGVVEPLGEFVADLAIGTVIGVAGGLVLAVTISSRRAGIWRESAGLAVLAIVAIGYFSLDSAGGSGYLGAFLAGLIVGNMQHLGLAMHAEHEEDMRRFASKLSDVATLLVFVVLGVNLPLDDVAEHLFPALVVLAVLLLVARPLTVLACVLPDRGGGWTWREIAFLCWTRETGVVPAALVGVIVALGVPHGDVYASVVALAIVVTLLLQALPAPWLAGRLGLLDVRTAAGSDPLPTE
jgi:cell volume regulation protein A